MKAIVLAAGKGTRLLPLTAEKPKPMIHVAGKPIIKYITDFLSEHSIAELIYNPGYNGHKLDGYMNQLFYKSMKIKSHPEYTLENGRCVAKPLGSARSIRHIHENETPLHDDFVVLCGDAIVNFDLTSAIKEHKESGAICSLITTNVSNDMVERYGVVLSDDVGNIIHFQEKPKRREALSNTVNTGIYIFNPAVLNYIPDVGFFDIGSDLLPLLVSRRLKLKSIHKPLEWHDVGVLEDYWRINKEMTTKVKIKGEETRGSSSYVPLTKNMMNF